MNRTSLNWKRALTLATLGLFALFSGCECEDDYEFPATNLDRGNSEIDNALRMRFTESGVQFLEDNFKEILVGVLGDPDETDPEMWSSSLMSRWRSKLGFRLLMAFFPSSGRTRSIWRKRPKPFPRGCTWTSKL